MKIYRVLAIVIALLLFLGPLANASVGYIKDGSDTGNASKIDFKSAYTTFDGSKVTFYANGYQDGVTINVSSESNLTSAALAYGVIKLRAGGAKSISLAAGTAGQVVTILLESGYDSGDITITDDQLSSSDQDAVVETGWDDIVFDANNDTVTLLYVDDTYGWIIIGSYGVTVT